MPRGLKSGSSIYECSCGISVGFVCSCTLHRLSREYSTQALWNCNFGNWKKKFQNFYDNNNFCVAFLLDAKFNKFYSVAPDEALSREVKTAILGESASLYASKMPRF